MNQAIFFKFVSTPSSHKPRWINPMIHPHFENLSQTPSSPHTTCASARASHHVREFVATQIQPLQLCQSVDGPASTEHTGY